MHEPTRGAARPIIRIDDPDDDRISVYRNQKDQWLRAAHHPNAAPGSTGTGLEGGRFMAESAGVLEQLARSPHRTESVLLNEERVASLAGVLERFPDDVPVYAASRAVLERITGFDMHRGVLACGVASAPMGWRELASSCRVLVVLERLANHDNVGGLFRSLAALGGLGGGDRDGRFADVGVLLSPGCCDPLYRKAIRVSMGWSLRVPFAWAEPWPEALEGLAGMGWQTCAMTPAASAVPLGELEPRERGLAVVLGAEGPGLTDGAVNACTSAVRIPIDPRVDSLNVMTAGAVALAHLVRIPSGRVSSG